MAKKKNDNLVCIDDSSAKGEFNTLSDKTWFLYITYDNAPEIIRLPPDWIGRELRLYSNIKIVKGSDKSTKFKLSKGHWREIRKTLSDEKGQAFVLTKGCFIRIPAMCVNKKLRIYIEKAKIKQKRKQKGEIKDAKPDTESNIKEIPE